MPTTTGTKHRLGEIWDRLNEICRKLWDEDSPGAVGLQALIEEFRGEVHRVEQTLLSYEKALAEQRQSISKEYEDAYQDRVNLLQSQLERANSRVATLEAMLADREAEVKKVLGELAKKEAENVKFHDDFLKAASHSDEVQAKKMESFYQELQAKTAHLETLWASRQKTLEAEYNERLEALRKREEALFQDDKQRSQAQNAQHAKREKELRELQERLIAQQTAWESQKLKEEEELLKRDDHLKRQTHELTLEYQRKHGELQGIKDSMRREITELIRQYQAKVKSHNGAISS